jgi:hypothetical protein
LHSGALVALWASEIRFHDLRHTAASWSRMSGADIYTVAQLLGHKDLRIATRYQHPGPSFLAEAVTGAQASSLAVSAKRERVTGTVALPVSSLLRRYRAQTVVGLIVCNWLKGIGSAYGTRTRDLCLERAAC